MSTIVFIFKVILCELFIVCVVFAFLATIEITFSPNKLFRKCLFLTIIFALLGVLIMLIVWIFKNF